MSSPEIQKLVHELNVHQIELEMQNEALRKSQAETAESQYKYSDLYDFAPVGYFTFDKKGYIIEANVTGASLLGAEKRSLAKQPFQRFIVPGHFSIFQFHLQKAHETRSKQICKLKLAGKDGTPFDALIDTIAVIDDKGNFDHYRSSVTDITEITRAEALRESEIKYRGLYESTRDGMILTDMDGHILECNRAFSNMLGYSEEEIEGLTYQRMTPAKWHDTEKDIIKNKVLRTGYSDIYEKECIRKDGKVFPIFMRMWAIKDETGNVTGMWGIATDITKRKKTEEALEEKCRRLQQALDEVRTLRGILPICAKCKNIRDDKGYWSQIESYIRDHSEAEFSHGICPACAKKLYPEFYKEKIEEEKRHYPRKKVSFSALVSISDSDDKASLQTGLVSDISLGGVQISIPGAYNFEIGEDKKRSNISITFTLPNSEVPVTIECLPKYVLRSNNETYIGASLVDTDIESHKTLQQYLN
jgi:PAS domain S-box-containing protein